MREFDAVLCDLDGVLRRFDEDRQRWIERRYGLPVYATAFAPERMVPAVLGETTAAQWLASIAEALGGHPEAVRATEDFAAVEFWVDEQVRELLTPIRAVMPLLLVTNAMDDLDEHLARMGLRDFAHQVISSAMVGVAKPDRRIYEIAAAAAGVAPNRCLFIDDRAENVEAARELGMLGIHYHEIEDLALLRGVAGR
ncbi:HAD-IA family hydrolase [Nocardia sp. AG03]|uniref:HAD-IA family hydrolase n=1 Tax=Nocardia sp. AG03 TaxID=3025312 RepID=UPI002418148A|nr:HAD-IA family hydrolase [Nocardia sp. AG03]